MVICVDEFGPLNLQPHPGRQWALVAAGKGDTARPRRRRRRATYTRPHGVRHLFGAYDLAADKLYGHVKDRKGRTEFLAFCRYLRTLYPPDVRIAIVLDNFSPHLSTRADTRVGDWAEANNVELAYTPNYASWLNRIEAQFTRPALLLHRRHRPPQPPDPTPHDPPLHRLAEPQHLQQSPTGNTQPRKRLLTRH